MLSRSDSLPRNQAQRAKLVLALLVSAVGATCADWRQAGTPLDEGSRSVQAAANAGAGHHAPFVMAAARDKLERAQRLQAAGRQREALRLTAEAALDARLAQSIAQAAQARAVVAADARPEDVTTDPAATVTRRIRTSVATPVATR